MFTFVNAFTILHGMSFRRDKTFQERERERETSRFPNWKLLHNNLGEKASFVLPSLGIVIEEAFAVKRNEHVYVLTLYNKKFHARLFAIYTRNRYLIAAGIVGNLRHGDLRFTADASVAFGLLYTCVLVEWHHELLRVGVLDDRRAVSIARQQRALSDRRLEIVPIVVSRLPP